jgi:hypothetical protein
MVGGSDLNLVFAQSVENFRGNLLVLQGEFHRDSVKGAIFGAVRGIFTGAGS